jgi:hypothetical protein
MAKFDIAGSSSRFNQLESDMRNNAIKNQFEGYTRAPSQEPQQTIQKQQEIPQPEPMTTKPQLDQQGLPDPYKTVEWEGRKDKQGNLAIYKLPSGDQGGSYEVAGINDKYHPEAFQAIAALPPQERAAAAAEYIKGYTAPFVSQLPQAMRPFAQDLAFNRGMGGATKYIQQGLNALGQNVTVDGGLGPKTLQAIGMVQPQALMRAASDAQLQDEYRRAEIDPNRRKFIPGLEARIRNRLSAFGQG